MAYCIFDISNNRMSIPGWDVLNLAPTPTTSLKTCTIIGKPASKKVEGKICGKKAKYFITKESKEQCFCEMHAKKQTAYLMPFTKNLKSLKNEDLEKLIHQENLGLEKLKKQEMIDKLAQYYQERCLVKVETPKKVNAGEIDLITIGKSLKDSLDHLSQHLDNINYVLIENQISTIATRMKSIQGMLAQYFIMRYPDAKIEFISSHNKLKGFQTTSNTKEPAKEESVSKTKYKQNKNDGLAICRKFMDEDASNSWLHNWKQDFLSHPKKDDLADSFLQGIWYLKSKKIISYAENLKINIV